jgi:hypothetical protein
MQPDNAGTFQFPDVAPGKYGVALRAAGERWVAPAGSMIEFDVPGGGVSEVDLAVPVRKEERR